MLTIVIISAIVVYLLFIAFIIGCCRNAARSDKDGEEMFARYMAEKEKTTVQQIAA